MCPWTHSQDNYVYHYCAKLNLVKIFQGHYFEVLHWVCSNNADSGIFLLLIENVYLFQDFLKYNFFCENNYQIGSIFAIHFAKSGQIMIQLIFYFLDIFFSELDNLKFCHNIVLLVIQQHHWIHADFYWLKHFSPGNVQEGLENSLRHCFQINFLIFF